MSGKGLIHAQILVMAEIFDKIRTRIATGGTAEMAAAAGARAGGGFTGYTAVFASPTPGVARWGDYSAAVFADGAIWMGNEFIPNIPRTVNANWGTFLSRLLA